MASGGSGAERPPYAAGSYLNIIRDRIVHICMHICVGTFVSGHVNG